MFITFSTDFQMHHAFLSLCLLIFECFKRFHRFLLVQVEVQVEVQVGVHVEVQVEVHVEVQVEV